jgi:hypothetical protein
MKSKSPTITKGKTASERRIPPVHPGEILLEEFLKPLGLSQYRLAKGLSVPARRINEIVLGVRSITAENCFAAWPGSLAPRSDSDSICRRHTTLRSNVIVYRIVLCRRSKS